jgi:hypothetical protein
VARHADRCSGEVAARTHWMRFERAVRLRKLGRTALAPVSIPPEVLKPVWSWFGAPRGMLDVAMSKIRFQHPRVAAGIGQGVARRRGAAGADATGSRARPDEGVAEKKRPADGRRLRSRGLAPVILRPWCSA